ncbi:anthocyanidin 3-O-glucosyltransferase 7 [Eucalyptus grandis]|uniref:anthocyanidin 3-O-glucosyltransferase 7 n=1 Tax=Eucalyptus grandis TaxID=71139 RepID=UPI00192E9B74|nr:anthocyanidin 3-O-glucosyltransferase 7 [Eucalyptus grandis]
MASAAAMATDSRDLSPGQRQGYTEVDAGKRQRRGGDPVQRRRRGFRAASTAPPSCSDLAPFSSFSSSLRPLFADLELPCPELLPSGQIEISRRGLVSPVAGRGEMAEKVQVPWVALWVPTPYCLAAHVYIDVISELRRESSGGGTSTDNNDDNKSLGVIPGLSMMRISDLPKELIDDQDTSRSACMLREVGRVLPRGTAAVVMNSFAEVTPTPLMADLKSKFKMLLQVGCLAVSFPPLPLPSSSTSDTTGCLTWLDAREPRSVAYICFGTVAMPSPSELSAIGEALESTKTPFLWSIKESAMAFLPEGLQERTREYGKFVPWAPQAQVLSHLACGVYVTHCGYISMFESVVGGVPMVCKPFWADNMMNGRMIEEVWGIGVKVKDGTITKTGIEMALEVVLRGEDGKEMRKKAGELRERLVEAAGPNGIADADFKVLVKLISTS